MKNKYLVNLPTIQEPKDIDLAIRKLIDPNDFDSYKENFEKLEALLEFELSPI